jgi:hypothetical protein
MEERGLGYISSLFYFHVHNFLGSFALEGGVGGSGVWGFYIKDHFVLLTFFDSL